MKLHTIARDKCLYNATATYNNGVIIVHKGSKINRSSSETLKRKAHVVALQADDSLFTEDNILNQDISFNSLSTAASFVTGRVANGMMVWKTDNGKYVRYTLREK